MLLNSLFGNHLEGQPPLNLQFRLKDSAIKKLFNEANISPEITYYPFKEYSLRCIELINDDLRPLIVFIHGAPGSSADFYSYLKTPALLNAANMMTLDRPGYGYSGLGKSITALQEQADAIASIISQRKNNRGVVVAAHSFGGPIALQLAAEFPNLVHKIMLLAPAIDPDHEKIFKIAYMGVTKPFRWLTPKALRVAADEKFSHPKELMKLQSKLPKIHQATCYIQGTSDRLVPFENMAYAKKWIFNAPLETIAIDNEDHFIPWSQKPLVTKKLLEWCENTPST